MRQKWFHLIGVCGKTTSNIAKMFQEMGWFVTGSDSQFYPPASDFLLKNKINIVKGFNFRHLISDFWKSQSLKTPINGEIPQYPDLVLFISHLDTKNKEFLFAKKNKLNILPYAKILKQYLIKEDSVVIAGTVGKTTTTALVVFLLQKFGIDPSYMVGGDFVDGIESLKITDSNISVVEGDEYHNPDPNIEGKAKFLEYNPKYLILTKIAWEHQDIFKTQDLYVEEFKKCVELLPRNGLLIAKNGDKNIEKLIINAKCKILKYGKEGESKESGFWSYRKEGRLVVILNPEKKEIVRFTPKLLGEHNIENILSAIVLLWNLNDSALKKRLSKEIIKKVIEEFNGVKKRLEIIYKDTNNIVIDDFGVTPERAKNSISVLKNEFPDFDIYSIFEPNAGSRTRDETIFNQIYKDSFWGVTELIIPDLSKNESLLSSEELTQKLNKIGFLAKYVPNMNLVDYLFSKNGRKKIFVFFSSYRLTSIAINLKGKLR